MTHFGNRSGGSAQTPTPRVGAAARPGPTPPAAVADGAREVDEIAEPCNRFQGRLAKITQATDALPVSIDGATISGPLWRAESAADFISDHGSTHPTCIPTAQGSAAELTVVVEVIAADGLSGEAELIGTLGAGDTWRGRFPVAVGTHTITVRLDRETTTLRAHRGDVVWRARVPGCGEKQMGRSRLEIYRVARPAAHAFLDPGRPVEALRFLYDKVAVSGIDVAMGNAEGDTRVTGRITNYLHGRHGLTYDTLSGAYAYLGPSGRSFALLAYLRRRRGPTVNCYDQAAGVYTLAGVMGMDGFTRFVEIFGFIQETTLVGGIRTNNPFHGNGLSNPIETRPPPRRTYFANHAFHMDRGSNMVFDACAGPHLGTEDYLTYMSASVDLSVVMTPFTNPASWRAGWNTNDTFIVIEALD